jgi:hypothetical protein
MHRTVLAIFMSSWAIGVSLAVSVQASASDSVRDTLKERFRISRMGLRPGEGIGGDKVGGARR